MRPPPPTDKNRLRRDVRARRDALPADERAHASAAIRTRLAALPQVRTARTMLAFASFGSEVDLDPLLRAAVARGAGVFLPFVIGFSPPRLGIARVRDLDDLVPGRMGIREPDPRTRRPARADRVDVVIAPGVAFDARCRRLGYGAGFYDRFLSALPDTTPVIAVAFEAQIVATVPHEPHDQPVSAVVTERRVVRPQPDADG